MRKERREIKRQHNALRIIIGLYCNICSCFPRFLSKLNFQWICCFTIFSMSIYFWTKFNVFFCFVLLLLRTFGYESGHFGAQFPFRESILKKRVYLCIYMHRQIFNSKIVVSSYWFEWYHLSFLMRMAFKTTVCCYFHLLLCVSFCDCSRCSFSRALSLCHLFALVCLLFWTASNMLLNAVSQRRKANNFIYKTPYQDEIQLIKFALFVINKNLKCAIISWSCS